jgi:hypothetical protein
VRLPPKRTFGAINVESGEVGGASVCGRSNGNPNANDCRASCTRLVDVPVQQQVLQPASGLAQTEQCVLVDADSARLDDASLSGCSAAAADDPLTTSVANIAQR